MASSANILSGVCRVFIGVSGTDVMPADTVALGGSWGGTWRDIGYTSANGVTISFQQAYTAVETAQDRQPVLQLAGNANDRISFEALEATLQNIKDATGRGSIVSVAPVGATPGHDILTLSVATNARVVAIGFEGLASPNTKSNPCRLIFPAAMATANVTLNQRIGQPEGIPMEFTRMGGVGNDPQWSFITTT